MDTALTIEEFVKSRKPADTLLSREDVKRIAHDYGYDCHLRWSVFSDPGGKGSGLVAYLVSSEREIQLGVWGALRQWQEPDVRTLMDRLISERSNRNDHTAN